MRHDLALHKVSGIGRPALGCERCEEDMREAGIEVEHLAQEDGACVISVGDRKPVPCPRHVDE